MKLAVTGSTGFLGRAFVPRALAAGHEVRVLVDRREATAEGVTRVDGTLEEAGARRTLLSGADVLLHLAARGVQNRDRDWTSAVDVNVRASLDLLLDATERVASHSVLVSTCLEYKGFGHLPDSLWHDSSETCDEEAAIDPSDAYAASKAAAGYLFRALCRERNHPAWYLRLAGVYGPGDDEAKVIPAAFRAARSGAPFRTSPGDQVRDWLWVDDAAEGLLRACTRRPTESPTACNLGSGEGVSLKEVVEAIFDVTGARREGIEWGALPYRKREPHVLVLDPRRAERLLGFRASTPIARGLRLLQITTRQVLD